MFYRYQDTLFERKYEHLWRSRCSTSPFVSTDTCYLHQNGAHTDFGEEVEEQREQSEVHHIGWRLAHASKRL